MHNAGVFDGNGREWSSGPILDAKGDPWYMTIRLNKGALKLIEYVEY